MEAIAKRQYEQLRIYINGILHIQLKLQDLIGFQSWIHGEREYYIEYYFQGNNKITTAYGEKDKWVAILKLLEDNISVIG